MRMMETMIGKTTNNATFEKLYNQQLLNQTKLIQKGVYENIKSKNTKCAPSDDVSLMSYHIQQLVSEIGEVLGADKRWKSHRNNKYDEKEKLDEIADCFIVLMNVAMFSGFDESTVINAIQEKLKVVAERIEKL